METWQVKFGGGMASTIYPERSRLKTSERVEAAFRLLGSQRFDDIALAVRKVYVEDGRTVDAARKRIERTWAKVFIGTIPLPSLPARFLTTQGPPMTASAPFRLTGVLPDKRIGSVTYVGSFSGIFGYLRADLPTWVRPLGHS